MGLGGGRRPVRHPARRLQDRLARARSTTRSPSSRCRSRISRCSPRTRGSAGRSMRSSRPAPCRASRGELYEAAEIDGASAWQKFKNVTLPFLRPAMLPYAIYGFVVTFNLFYLSFFMTGGGPFGRTEILVTQAYRLVNDRAVRDRGGVLASTCSSCSSGSRWSRTDWRKRRRAMPMIARHAGGDRGPRRCRLPAAPASADPRRPGEGGEVRRAQAAARPPDRPADHLPVHHATVLFPIVWIFSWRSTRGTSPGPRARPDPAGRVARRVRAVIDQPTSNPDQLPRAGAQQLQARRRSVALFSVAARRHWPPTRSRACGSAAARS